MQEFALTLSLALTRLIIPIGVVAIAVGLILFGTTVSRRGRAVPPHQPTGASGRASDAKEPNSPAIERIAVGLCAVLALAGAVAIVTNEIRRTPASHPAFPFLLALVVLLGAPALTWRSPRRVAAEGMATVALAVVTVLTGFSIGFLFVPLLAVMTWVCFQHLRGRSNHHGSSAAPPVDSSP